jgi:hypothetical protein
MLIALLMLGVDLIVIVAFVLPRKRLVMCQPGVPRGVIRVAIGDIDQGIITVDKSAAKHWLLGV